MDSAKSAAVICKRIVASCLAAGLVVLGGCDQPAPPVTVGIRPSDAARVVQLTLSREESPDSELWVKLTMKNVGQWPFGWDSECSVFLEWFVWIENDRSVSDQVVSELVPEPSLSNRNRYVVVEPGQEITRIVRLTDRFREYTWDSHDAIYDSHHFIARERMFRFVLPHPRKTQVWAEYAAWRTEALENGAGLSKRELGFPDGYSKSNKLIVGVK
jgi:hypothetical protein